MKQTAKIIDTIQKDEICKECSWWEQCMTLTVEQFTAQHDSCFETGEPFYVPA